jgi:hypothetical protein
MFKYVGIFFCLLVVCLALPSTQSSNSGFAVPVSTKWQIILTGVLASPAQAVPDDAIVWDVDLFSTPAETIAGLKAMGKTVLCYFSAGTSEPNRPDLGTLAPGDIGKELRGWPGEYWLNLKSATVWNIMAGRIALASSKGCDAIDPDNMGKQAC